MTRELGDTGYVGKKESGATIPAVVLGDRCNTLCQDNGVLGFTMVNGGDRLRTFAVTGTPEGRNYVEAVLTPPSLSELTPGDVDRIQAGDMPDYAGFTWSVESHGVNPVVGDDVVGELWSRIVALCPEVMLDYTSDIVVKAREVLSGERISLDTALNVLVVDRYDDYDGANEINAPVECTIDGETVRFTGRIVPMVTQDAGLEFTGGYVASVTTPVVEQHGVVVESAGELPVSVMLNALRSADPVNMQNMVEYLTVKKELAERASRDVERLING